ncbi:MAG: 16S rRNA (cytidine(1402)-2'-O)-methyltransferase [Hyphomicrobiales bacterium]
MTLQKPRSDRRYSIGAAQFEAEKLEAGLHVVATPIGNLGDITIRALATLTAADAILCEDTRTTAKLLERYGIGTKLRPYHEHNAAKVRPGIVEKLKSGLTLALVSDAGMPLISDPGYRLVAEALEAGIAVTACPGPSAVLTGLALSGLPTDRFTFLGFLPAKAGDRKRLYGEFAGLRSTLVFFESPHRIVATLAEIEAAWPGRQLAVARELTKLHEEVLRGSARELRENLAARTAVKGEITVIAGPPPEPVPASGEEVDAALAEALAAMPAGRAAAEVARRFNLPRKEAYARILARKKATDG